MSSGDGNEKEEHESSEVVVNYEPEPHPLKEVEVEVTKIIQRLEANVAMNDTSGTKTEQRKVSVGFFEPEKTNMNEVLKNLEEIIDKTDPNKESDESPLRPMTSMIKSVVLAHSLAAYLSNLERSHITRLNCYISAETNRWITHMFRFFDYNTYYHSDHLEGLVKITRMMLHYKYPRYLEDGALALTEKLPSIYSSVASPLGIVQHLCRQLGLPLACIRPVPVSNIFGATQSMDLNALHTLLQEDTNSNTRVPLIVVADAGTNTLGQCDNVTRLNELCKAFDVWLHVRGHSLAALAIAPTPVPAECPKIADSATLTLGPWLGVQGLPVVTVFRMPQALVNDHTHASTVNCTRESTLGAVAGLSGAAGARRLPALPLWTALKVTGHCFRDHLTDAFRKCHAFYNAVNIENIVILSKQPGGDRGLITIDEIASKPIDTNLLWDVVVPCVVFQYNPCDKIQQVTTSYCNKLNSWLGQIMQREMPQLNIELCETESNGIVLRYCPLECGVSDAPITTELLEELKVCLTQQLEILQATVALKDSFCELVKASPVLRLVEIPGWAGLGGVRFVPEMWESIVPDAEELDMLTSRLVDRLRTTDQAFSTGPADDGHLCIRFGMVTADTDIDELLSLVISVGREVESQSKVLDNLNEIVKKGIETAQAELERANSSRLWAEGVESVLRKVPVVGRLADWWAVPSAAPPGRTLHLAHGTLTSTENIYKYHMQLPAGSVPHSMNKPTPEAQSQTNMEPVQQDSSVNQQTNNT